ncbi:MAG: hypothetical protein KC416_05895, partial [Myxococcales bacterium]|nr:hypothetical protein [Myxococcales bacterium]
VLRMTMTADGDTFHVLTEGMFTDGQFWRRARAARQLREGDGERTYPYAWTKVVEVLRTGWDGTGGVSKRQARTKLWEALNGADEDLREVAAELLLQIPERGLLLRARDEKGPGADAARGVLVSSAS